MRSRNIGVLAVALALGLSSFVATGCKGEDKRPAMHVDAGGEGGDENEGSGRDGGHCARKPGSETRACRVYLAALRGEYPRTFTYEEAEELVAEIRKVVDLEDRGLAGEVTREDGLRELEKRDAVCERIAGLGCFQVMYGRSQ